MSDVITCPSGLSGRIRGLKVREERILADRKLAKAGAQLDELLSSCWLETLDPGPYEDPLDWSKVLQGDRFFVLLMVRALSYGPEYAFAVTCESRGCRGRIQWELDLTQLPVRTLSEESRARFLAGNVFETTLPGALARATFHLATGADERRMAQSRKAAGDRPLTTLLAARLDGIDGVEPREKAKFIEDLAMSDVRHLLAEFDRVDCGVETTIEVECPDCGTRHELELPFEQGFFLPLKEKPTPRDRTSSSLR